MTDTEKRDQRVTELEAELAEQVERDRLREIEIRSLHDQLNLYTAFNHYVEAAIAEQRQQLTEPLAQLHRQLETVLSELAEQRRSLEEQLAEQRQSFQAKLAEEHQVIEAALAEQRHSSSRAQLQIAELTESLHGETSRRQAAEDMLAAERSRVSYRAVQRLLRVIPTNRS